MCFDIGGLSNGFLSRRLSNKFQKQNSFVLKIVFIHGKCMCEGVGEDSRHGAWHVDIHIEICMFYLNVCGCVNMELHVHLGGEQPL